MLVLNRAGTDQNVHVQASLPRVASEGEALEEYSAHLPISEALLR